MTQPTKRARKKDSTMLNNQARKKEAMELRERVQKLEEILRVFKVALFQWLR